MMINKIIDFINLHQLYFFKFPGNVILRLLRYDVKLNEDSYGAYAWGIGFWLTIFIVAGIIYYG
jgi:hypothetical protein